MQHFGASVFHMVVHWHKLGEVKNECTLHNFVVLAINTPKIIKVSNNLTKVMTKTILTVFFLRQGVNKDLKLWKQSKNYDHLWFI